MNTYFPYFDPADVDTPEGMVVTAAASAVTGVPATGTGLSGSAYAPGDRINSITDLRAIIAANTPDATFETTEFGYAAGNSDTTIAEFLAHDAASISGNGGLEMGPSGMVFEGFLYIPPGVHEIAITSDDGFALSIGGVAFSDFEGARATETTARVAEFEGGLYEIELLYFDQGGGMALSMEIDGFPVDQSAFYQSAADFTNPPSGTAVVPVDEYHPSHFIGEAVVDDGQTPSGTTGPDVLQGDAGDETISGGAGDDIVHGGYGDDLVDGGDGDDLVDGGRGSDWVRGGSGNDIILSRADGGEQRIGQIAVDEVGRPDGGEVNYDREKLIGWEDQALVADDILEGGAGSDLFLISPQINAKLEIIEEHVRKDGTINWAGVAGENDELHDHWVDIFGIDIIADYDADEDQIAVIGHTANVYVSHRDTDGDGDEESIVTVISKQHGGGGAHDEDLIGQLIVFGDRVEKDDMITDDNVTYGIVEGIADVAEAIFPVGETKTTPISAGASPGAITGLDENGNEVIFGYDTRDAGATVESEANYGTITGSPEDFSDNPFLAQAEAGFADPTPSSYEQPPTRDPFEPLGFEAATAGETKNGGGGADLIAPTADPDVALAPLGHWSFSASDGSFDDSAGGPEARAYTLYENQAQIRTDGVVAGPDGSLNALSFNGEDEFAYVPHDPAYQITQGTIALWVNPADLDDESMFVTKDQRNTGDGGHFRLGHTKDGGLFLRFAPGDGDGNKEWKTGPILSEGQWQHVAVNFTEDGVTVYLDGQAVPNGAWQATSGNVPNPGAFKEAFILNNKEPWVLAADQARTEYNETAQVFGADDEDLDNAFEGALAEFAVFGGSEVTDALTAAEIAQLATPGFDASSFSGETGPQPIEAAADTFSGGDGNDTILGEGGDDTLNGGAGNDSIEGGYNDDLIDGGDGDDTLDGGRGSDLLIGGSGNDVLRATSDAGEDRAAQLLSDTGNQRDPLYIDEATSKLWDWSDQPFVADDILVGGEGEDHFLFELQINGTIQAIMDNLIDGQRDIRWHGVAGENKYIHEHWVDSIGIDVIADFNADEDQISVLGHTTNVRVDYISHDSDDDGVADSILSVIEAYSQQGNGGGAHDEDLLGYIVVHGDMVTEDMITTDAGVHYGIVDTIDELQEGFAPSGETRTNTIDGQEVLGLDTRHWDDDPIGTDPLAFAENPYEALAEQYIDDAALGDAGPLAAVVEAAATVDYGPGASAPIEIPHAADQARAEGSWTLSFVADTPTNGQQALLSKDHSGNKTGGHLTIYLEGGYLKLRFQDDGNTSTYLKYSDEKIQAGETYHIAFTFTAETIALYVNGELVDAEDGFADGMAGNAEDTVIGASTRTRQGENDNLQWFFDGRIGEVAMLDRALEPLEALLLAEAGGDIDTILSDAGDDTGDAGDDTGDAGDDAGDAGDDAGDAGDDAGDAGDDAGDAGDDTGDAGDDAGDAGDDAGDAGDDTGDAGDDAGDAGDDTGDAGDDAGDAGDDTGDADDDTGDAGDETGDAGDGTGDAGDDTGDAGDDAGDAGDDTGDAGDDATGAPIMGDSDNNRIDGTENDDVVMALAGDDRVLGLAGDDTLYGNDGNDRINGGVGSDSMIGGAGDDNFIVDDEADIVVENVDKGRDVIRSSVTYTIASNVEMMVLMRDASDIDGFGNAEDNRIIGSMGDNIIAGEDGNDLLKGKAGDDELSGGGGNDSLLGQLGDDILDGGDGNDRLRGGEGDDELNGGAGNDTATAGGGDDTLAGGSGDDRMGGGAGDDELSGGAGNDTMAGQAGDDTVSGAGGDDRLRGGLGDDELDGGAGADTVIGGSGDDVLRGGLDRDRLRGGEGEDEFFFSEFGDANYDRIMDFEQGLDSIVLDGSVFTAITAASLENAFALSEEPLTATDHLIYEGQTGKIYYDVDGSGAAVAELVAQVGRGLDLDWNDFVMA